MILDLIYIGDIVTVLKLQKHSLAKCRILVIQDTQNDNIIFFLNCNLQAVQERTLQMNKPGVFWRKRAS